ncbi:3-dehydroquinate synthase [Methylonatrum kenyense]|uniref:3-dehydroquinate synthase n=1 Tax=Methylonatrum kenyense TaxID=455253 RepID=UPI0020C0BE6C|nr:3-dehydroquinate synthase [Methylonatrum kenyense]MCK8516844.1 3-dehydroquinate synthase [Methylonatrum kenyense]
MKTLHVDLGERSYPIHIGAGLLEQDALIRPHLRGRQVLVVSNTTVAPLYLERLLQRLDGLDVDSVILPDGEQYKSLDICKQVYDRLLERRFDRKCMLVALGGGVIGDLTGFVAASYQRGVDFIQIPTTLLAQVDSSVGGKTGVNHPLGKNMIGAFHQPRCVIADTATLGTLPDREMSAGIAEVIKYGLIRDAGFFDWLENHVESLLQHDEAALTEAILRSCAIKAEVVAADEREGGLRAILNLGHTFGHAIETASGYGNWLHGEAVGAGMVMAAHLAREMDWIDQQQFERARQLILRAGLPDAPPAGMSAERFLELMAVDKKAEGGRLRLVLQQAIGKAVVTDTVPMDSLRRTLDHFVSA